MLMAEFDLALEKINSLVKDFQANERHYKAAGYSEAQARKDFIDKFWIALGWDVNHDQQTNPYEQEVKVEKNVATAHAQRRADYAFYLAPNYHDVRFFVEAKKPSVDIATKESCFQLIRYGWNSGTPVAVLTDFEQLLILDCRYRPDMATALSQARDKFHYTEYTNRDKFANIYWWFSREAVADGSIEKRAKELPKPRGKAAQRGLFPGGYQSIDESFLAELDEYRKSLALTFKKENPAFNSEDLTELAQRTLDRLVFLRFLEDKGIEPKRLVENFGDKGTAWEDFIAASRRLNKIYNGIVYGPHSILDDPKFHVDDTAFAHICEDLSHINSPYDFNAIPIHILGSIYERFLGKVVEATAKRAKVVEKPEVRKAGGVYYTPEYIVRYIVENTVGKLIAGKTPAQIAKMRFADIACGSGSFLLGVYNLLLNYHGQYYNDNPRRAIKGACIKREGILYLSLAKKREILLNNIYGVDIDTQAVEVCQLSLYLKLLEEETEASARQYLLDFEHTAQMKQLLPDLSKNIVCGNSLVGWDIENDLFGNDDVKNLNPMNFEDAFPEVMKRGGFDAIGGNPPWGADLRVAERRSLVERYTLVPTKTKDSYLYFMCRAIDLLRESGSFGYIVPNTWLLINTACEFRRHLLSYDVEEIVEHGDGVFAQATVESSTLVLTKAKNQTGPCHAVRIRKGQLVLDHLVDKRIWLEDEYSRIIVDIDQRIHNLLIKVRAQAEPFDKDCVIIWGIKPYQVGYGIPPQTKEMVEKRVFHSTTCKGKDWKPLLVGSDVNRYTIHFPGQQYIKYGKWLMYPSNEELMQQPKILLRQTSDILRVCYDEKAYYCQNSVFIIHSTRIALKYLVGLLNSKLLGFLYKFRNPQTGKVFAEIKPAVVKELPIRRVDFSDPADKSRHDKMVAKVEAMLEAKKQLAKARTDKDKNYYENKCAALDRQIDRLVYDLYGLTEDEIAIVEGGPTK